MLQGLSIDETRERMGRLRHTGRQEATDLVEQPLLELRVDAPRDAKRRRFRRNA